MSNPIELNLSPSRAAGICASLPWLALSAVLLAISLSITPLALVLLPVSLLLGWQEFRRCGRLRGANAIISLTTDDRHLRCQLANGQEVTARVCGCSSLGASFLVLKVESVVTRSDTMTAILLSPSRLCRGNVSEQAFRRLRMWLVAGPAAISR
ncbi:MAG TPA: hypothetical protein DCX68_14715 [Marinobacter hydrocarbonoclasticus]|uniref:hypothetical protein n=1 Tax=Marinobacter TaxID=2742 RepID=UPI000C47978D|nr:hypothetical protein [Marinobacter sp. UBA5687]MAL34231.1 hypothetical protein [Marinobacter sp.]MEC9040810.1 hypothetical protein [Pseudomonadota bacterium]HAX11284.1 hypothetical protein [Marinobacter nauticus]HCL37097.1 hypothetical protein [Marinobacter nauticus]HCP20052.1 hypothetical protein [Marinobacter nauticus]